jgi:hypothetical protein
VPVPAAFKIAVKLIVVPRFLALGFSHTRSTKGVLKSVAVYFIFVGTDMSREIHLKRHYGMSLDHYEQLLAEQGGFCAVCRSPPNIVNGIERPLSVDHSYKSGANRGLLCDRCNLILGHAGDSQELLRRLQVYLAKHDGENSEFAEQNPECAAARGAE